MSSIKSISIIILENLEEFEEVLQEIEYKAAREIDKTSKTSNTEINLISKGFCMPEPPDGIKTKTNKERAKEAFEWNLCVKQRKETTIVCNKKGLPVRAIMNIIDFI